MTDARGRCVNGPALADLAPADELLGDEEEVVPVVEQQASPTV